MRFEIPNKWLATTVVSGACFAAGMGAAAEFPDAEGALVYSGLITDDAGNPRTTSETIVVTLHSAESGGTVLCTATEPGVDLSETHGRFSVAMPELCTSAIADAGDAWAQVKVGSTTLPRQKLGAVPFALVARESQTTNSVATDTVDRPQLSPTLRDAIAALETEVEALTSHRLVVATIDPTTLFPAGTGTVQVRFDGFAASTQSPEDFDLDTDRFTPQVAGLYQITAQLRSGHWADDDAWIELDCSGGSGHGYRAGNLGLRAYESIRGTWLYALEPGDTCQLVLSKDFAEDVPLTDGDRDPVNSFFQASRIGN